MRHKTRIVLMTVAVLSVMLLPLTPSGANHSMAEGCVIVPAVGCSYTTTAGHTIGAVGVGPFTVAWENSGAGCANGSKSFAIGEPVPAVRLVDAPCAGTLVTVTGLGTGAVGDPD